MKPRSAQTVIVKEGSVTVKIYPGVNRVGGKDYPQFRVVYWEGDVRQENRHSKIEKAKSEAKIIARKIARGETDALSLTGKDRDSYIAATNRLKPLGVPLVVAVEEYAHVIPLLPKGTTLKEAVQFFLKRNPANLIKRTVQQVVDEMIETKRVAKLSDIHLKDLDSRLGKFARDFQLEISSVTGALLQAWLDELEVAGRTKQNYFRMITALFRFAASRKYLTKDALEELEAVQQAKAEANEIEIFTPAEMAEILAVARPEMIPWFTIGGFAGLRAAEIARLDWSEVNLTEGHIEIKAGKAKTAARRLAPITPNLAAWITPHAQKSGPVVAFESWWNQIPRLVEAINRARKEKGIETEFKWRHNGLRHSFCSYRLAEIKDAAKVALEAGNSPQMIFKHYRQVVTDGEAKKWFSVVPHKAENIVQFEAKAAA